jgi:hypothetical protein
MNNDQIDWSSIINKTFFSSLGAWSNRIVVFNFNDTILQSIIVDTEYY